MTWDNCSCGECADERARERAEELPEGDEIADLHLPDGSCCDEEVK